MVYKRFSVLVIVRIGLMLINMTLIAGLVTNLDKLFTSMVLILILIAQTYELLHYINKTNRSLSNFLDALKDKSFSTQNVEILNKSFQSLNRSFKDIAETIFNTQLEKEAQFHLLNLIINKVQTGIILIDGNQKVNLINQAASAHLNLKNNTTFENLAKKIDGLQDFTHINSEIKKILELDSNQKKQQFLTYFTPIQLIDQKYLLITFNDIQEELDKKEVQSWQKLLRTLSHEIMNSVTPISSLAETSRANIENENGELKDITQINSKNLERIQKALITIDRRSSGLYQFVNDFRKLAKIPDPVKEEFYIQDLFSSVVELIFQDKHQENLHLTLDVAPVNLILNADFKLIEQVLINLLLNAKDATAEKEHIHITLKAYQSKNSIYIHVSDNGNGIPSSKLDQIFIPFFTTKAGGSGIGLSLCRQIMQMHGGNISVKSEPNVNTTFTLQF